MRRSESVRLHQGLIYVCCLLSTQRRILNECTKRDLSSPPPPEPGSSQQTKSPLDTCTKSFALFHEQELKHEIFCVRCSYCRCNKFRFYRLAPQDVIVCAKINSNEKLHIEYRRQRNCRCSASLGYCCYARQAVPWSFTISISEQHHRGKTYQRRVSNTLVKVAFTVYFSSRVLVIKDVNKAKQFQ